MIKEFHILIQFIFSLVIFIQVNLTIQQQEIHYHLILKYFYIIKFQQTPYFLIFHSFFPLQVKILFFFHYSLIHLKKYLFL